MGNRVYIIIRELWHPEEKKLVSFLIEGSAFCSKSSALREAEKYAENIRKKHLYVSGGLIYDVRFRVEVLSLVDGTIWQGEK